eukprot:3657214-Pyramimonas_sp.AAC.1
MASDYLPQNILLTGGAGFIAGHVAALLCRKYPQYKEKYVVFHLSLGGRLGPRPLVTDGRGVQTCVGLLDVVISLILRHHLNHTKYNDKHVVVLDKLDYCSSVKNFDAMRDCPNFKFVKGDISSADLVNFLLSAEKIDTIMHFAAQGLGKSERKCYTGQTLPTRPREGGPSILTTHVDNSFGNSFDFTMNNIFGTHVLLEAARVVGGIRRFIHVSTDE